jgi:predicted porin
MKKTLIALAAVAATGTAFAQSSVTMYGLVDMAVTSIKQGGDTITSLANEGQASNRLGFRGVEDLGGGMSATFVLEGGLSPDTGTPGGLNFLRQSTLGLRGGFGEVRLGRDYTPTFWNHSAYTVFGTNGLGNSATTFSVLGSGASTLVRADNSISYFTPNISGFQAQAMFSLKESAASNTPNEYAGIRLTYNAGPLSASLATASEGSNVAANSYKRTNMGATYDFGMAKVFFFHVRSEFGARKNNQTALGVTAPVGPGTIKASYLQANYNAAAGDTDAKHMTIGYDYPLSKRTIVYAVASKISNKSNANFSVNYANSGSGALPAVTPGKNSGGYAIGVRHSF